MSEVAGRLAIEAAGSALRRHAGGRGLLIGACPASPRLGSWWSEAAWSARMQHGWRPAWAPKLQFSRARSSGFASWMNYSKGASARDSQRWTRSTRRYLRRCGHRCGPCARRERTEARQPRHVELDAQGIGDRGCRHRSGGFETSRPTTHPDPTYEIDGVIHYCVANMPGAVPLTSSQALNNTTLPFGLALAAKGFEAVLENPHLRAGLNVYRGRLTYKAVAESLGLPFSPIEQAPA